MRARRRVSLAVSSSTSTARCDSSSLTRARSLDILCRSSLKSIMPKILPAQALEAKKNVAKLVRTKHPGCALAGSHVAEICSNHLDRCGVGVCGQIEQG